MALPKAVPVPLGLATLLVIALGLAAAVPQWPFVGAERVSPDFYYAARCEEKFGVTFEVRTLDAVIHRKFVMNLAADTVAWPCEPESP